MKRILITGANSYIGTSFEKYIQENDADAYTVATIDMIDGSWREASFSGYDAIFHVAGLAHSDTRKVNQERKALYYEINTDLAIETAKKAKADGVKQFILMSSIIVYGDSAPIGERKMITKDTPLSPASCYGDSKAQAENGVMPLQDESFHVVVLRPPMIYGKGCKGNYPTLAKMALKLPVFPKADNCRSMLYIENLCAFVRLMIENDESGVFWPQNAQWANTSDLVRLIAAAHGKRIRLTRAFNWAMHAVRPFTRLLDKAFGSMVYDQGMSAYRQPYQHVGFEESIRRTESTGEGN